MADKEPLDRDFRIAVGELIAASGQLEVMVNILLWGLVGVDQKVGQIALPDQVSRQLDVVNQLLPLRVPDEELRGRVKEWTAQARALYQERNLVVHRTWIGPGDSSDHLMLPKRMDGEPETKRASDVLDVANRILQLAGPAGSFLGDLARSVPGPWAVYRS